MDELAQFMNDLTAFKLGRAPLPDSRSRVPENDRQTLKDSISAERIAEILGEDGGVMNRKQKERALAKHNRGLKKSFWKSDISEWDELLTNSAHHILDILKEPK